jgi:hypothetical protein
MTTITDLLNEAANELERREPIRVFDAKDMREWARVLRGRTLDSTLPENLEELLEKVAEEVVQDIEFALDSAFDTARAVKRVLAEVRP